MGLAFLGVIGWVGLLFLREQWTKCTSPRLLDGIEECLKNYNRQIMADKQIYKKRLRHWKEDYWNLRLKVAEIKAETFHAPERTFGKRLKATLEEARQLGEKYLRVGYNPEIDVDDQHLQLDMAPISLTTDPTEKKIKLAFLENKVKTLLSSSEQTKLHKFELKQLK